MKRKIGAILFVLYSIIAITVTVLLLSYNECNISEVGGYTIYPLTDDSFEPQYEEGSILIIKETSDKHIKAGDKAFFYRVINSAEFEFVTVTIADKQQSGRRITYVSDTGEGFDSQYLAGKVEDTTVLGSPWGTILSILESKWGYLFCIVIVSLLLFLQEVFDLIIEIKYGGAKGTKAANISNARKNATKTSSAAKKTTAKPATAKTTASKSTTTKAATSVKKVATVAKVNNDTETKVEEEV